jgi:hypothetical protein
LPTRHWTLEAARALLPEVRRRTARAVEATEALLIEREALAEGEAGREALEGRIQEEVSRWAREMEALGLEVKGPWLVDFDSGGGCYCWKWPEEGLEFFHGYEEGFGGRTRIQ